MKKTGLQTVTLLLLLLLVVGLTACMAATTQPYQKARWDQALIGAMEQRPGAVLLRFEEVLPDRPLNETTWHIKKGPTWDPQRSHLIGFYHDYKVSTIGAGQSTTVGITSIATHIVIPFGQLFPQALTALLESSFESVSVAYDDATEIRLMEQRHPDYVIRIQVEDFQLWEEPSDYLNLTARVETSMVPLTGDVWDARVAESDSEVRGYRISAVTSTSGKTIQAINRAANQLSAQLAREVIEEAFE
ncbi:MAG: hypothetical protein JW937_08380 [Candidatus Omnitrophica bacterium]|nr:hypothetical protein [Candidatus Omnitrophota bacterium]